MSYPLMATTFSINSLLNFAVITTAKTRRRTTPLISCSSSSIPKYSNKFKSLVFPYVSDDDAPTRKLMVELLSTVDEQLGSSLHPTCTLPPDVQHFQNSTNTARASLHLRSGLPSSQIDFILGGWIHCKLPSGEALNIGSLAAYLKPSTDAPHLLMDLIQTSPTSVVLVLDLAPRKDLTLSPDYLKKYYEDTELDRHRQRLLTLPEVRPYFSSSLYIRAVFSPTAIVVTVDTANMEEVIEEHVAPIAKELLHFWIESCACFVREVEASERAHLNGRDRVIKSKIIEVDLGSSFPRLFGQEIADRVFNALSWSIK